MPKQKNVVNKLLALEDELVHFVTHEGDVRLVAPVANVLRGIDQLHATGEFYREQERPPLTDAKQAVADANAELDAAAAKRHAAAKAEQDAREGEAKAAGIARRHEVLTKRARVGRA
jgi:hypothetical protein